LYTIVTLIREAILLRKALLVLLLLIEAPAPDAQAGYKQTPQDHSIRAPTAGNKPVMDGVETQEGEAGLSRATVVLKS
jgi:hypothetical protein